VPPKDTPYPQSIVTEGFTSIIPCPIESLGLHRQLFSPDKQLKLYLHLVVLRVIASSIFIGVAFFRPPLKKAKYISDGYKIYFIYKVLSSFFIPSLVKVFFYPTNGFPASGELANSVHFGIFLSQDIDLYGNVVLRYECNKMCIGFL